MASVIPTPSIKSSKPQVQLIPWDPTSPEHVQRLVQQRIACGWDHEAVEGWKAAQESGKFNLQWVVSTLPHFTSYSEILIFAGSRRFRSRERGQITQACCGVSPRTRTVG